MAVYGRALCTCFIAFGDDVVDVACMFVYHTFSIVEYSKGSDVQHPSRPLTRHRLPLSLPNFINTAGNAELFSLVSYPPSPCPPETNPFITLKTS